MFDELKEVKYFKETTDFKSLVGTPCKISRVFEKQRRI